MHKIPHCMDDSCDDVHHTTTRDISQDGKGPLEETIYEIPTTWVIHVMVYTTLPSEI